MGEDETGVLRTGSEPSLESLKLKARQKQHIQQECQTREAKIVFFKASEKMY